MKNKLRSKVRDLEKLSKENFWKDKILLKDYKTKNIFDEILNSYQSHIKEINNIKELFNLVARENEEIIEIAY